MKLTIVNIYPRDTVARYLLSGYVLKGYLDKCWNGENLDVEVLNFNEKVQPEDLSKVLLETRSDIIGYSCYIWNAEKILEVVKKLRAENRNIIHVLGGPEISVQRILSLHQPSVVDYYIIGEGEKKLLNLIKYINAKKKNKDIALPKSVAYWGRDKLKHYDSYEDSVTDLDEIPSIYLEGVIDKNLYERQQVFLETQRGCIFKCKYCVYHKFLSSVRYYSLERVLQELDYLILEKKVTALRITDAIFTSDLKRAKEIVRHLVELKDVEGVNLPWIYWEFDYNYVDEEFIELTSSLKYKDRILNTDELAPLDRPQLYSDMLEDYTVVNSIGIESFYDKALEAVGRRRLHFKNFDAFMKLTREYNIAVKMDLILGLPFETLGTFFEGLEILLPYFKSTDHVLNIHHLQILPGSELEGLTGEYKIKYSRNAPHTVFSTNTLTEEDINYGLKLSAVLSRIINSPMRNLFFESWERSGEKLFGLVKKMYNEICSSGKFSETPLVKDKMLYDSYWNDLIYRDLPSDFINDLLRKCEKGD